MNTKLNINALEDKSIVYSKLADDVVSKFTELSEKVDTLSSATPDWNAQEGEAGYIENRTHYISEEIAVEKQYIGIGNNIEGNNVFNIKPFYRFNLLHFKFFIEDIEDNTTTVFEYFLSPYDYTKPPSYIGEYKYDYGKITFNEDDLSITITLDAPYFIKQYLEIDYINDIKKINDSFIPDTIARKSELTELSEEVGKKQDPITDLETIRSGAAKGATALQSIPSEYITENELTAKSYATTAALNNKVDKINGKGLSTEDFTTALKNKLNELSNYDDTSVFNAIGDLDRRLNILVEGDASSAIESFNEITAFLEGVQDTEDMAGIIASIEQQIAGKMDDVALATVATSGSYNDLSNKPTIPDAVTENTVSDWGFTKNAGTYSKPSTGIPKSDLASAVQTSLDKADTALQSYTEQYKGTVTGVKINGTTKDPSSGVVDLGTVITEHQTLKTINRESIVGSGDITISDVYITDFTVNDIEMLANGLSNNNIQADIAALYEAVSAHKLVLVPYDADEGYHGYGIVSGYMEDLFYITINLEQGRWFDLELDRFSNEIREDQIVNLRQWWDKQDTLISGTNIKTINNASILGEGNLNVLTGVPIATVDVLGGIRPLKTTSGSISMGAGSVISTNSAIALTAPTAANINSTSSPKNYPVIVDKAGVPFVNVPWTDDKVTATATTTTSFYVCGTSSSTTSIGALYKGAGVKVESGTKLYASGGFFQSSDKTLKDIHGNIEVDLEKLSKLNKIYFNFKNNKDTTHVGVIAQEVQELYPEIVTTDSETGKLAVEYDKLSVIALAAIDNLHEENKKLKNKTNDLEERLAKLESLFENQLNKSN